MGYPKYYKIKNVWDQIDMINEIMPIDFNEDVVERISKIPLPEKAEGWFVVPSLTENYVDEVEKTLSSISNTRTFYSHLELKRKNIKRKERTSVAISRLEKYENAGDIIIIPAQFGNLHRGLSIKEIETEKMTEREFGLGAYEVSWMLFTHPEREYKESNLHPVCIGDTVKVNKSFNFSPCFDYGEKVLELGAFANNERLQDFGAVTGFV
ncbi:MAG: hypothetical protein PHU17_00775 [Candidatus Pacebacteria bacterium]|nr:hypothetical protein [Candidatus Paceibacterota bacterium]MDD4074054.1 hypothetical protein [Candidatus Paceibacterota bacterium]